MQLSNKVYDTLKFIVMIVLPAIATLYIAISGVLVANGLDGLPYPEVVSGIITAVVTFLGTILRISTNSYSGDGTLKIDTTDLEKDVYQLALDTPVEDLKGKKSVTFMVDPHAKLDK